MHDWSNENVDWQGINDSARFIALWLRKWARMGVTDYKEKFGTVRIYCHFGWSSFYSVWRPSYMWVPKWWPWRLDLDISRYIFPYVNKVIIPLQQKAYAWRYKKAVQKWPHLYKEILVMADYGELFDGIVPGYKYSNYWRTLDEIKTKKKK